MKLCGFRRSRERRRGSRSGGHHLRDLVEITCSYKALVRDRLIPQLLGGEFFLLQLGICRHARLSVTAREMEHGHVQRVESGQRYELELVAHFTELLLEVRDRDVIQLFLPVERRRTV